MSHIPHSPHGWSDTEIAEMQVKFGNPTWEMLLDREQRIKELLERIADLESDAFCNYYR